MTDARYRTRPFAAPEEKIETPPPQRRSVRWSVEVTYEKVPDLPTEDQIDRLMDDNRTTMTHDENLGLLSVHWYQEEEEAGPDLLLEFITTAIPRTNELVAAAGITTGEAIRVDVHDDERPHRRRELYRYADFAFYADVSRQAVAQAAKTDPDFPRPVMHLSDGTPLYHPLRAIDYVHKRWPLPDDE